MKLKALALKDSIQLLANEHKFIRSDVWDIELSPNMLIRITSKKTGEVTYTTAFNARYWLPDEEEKPKK